jgi:hypothetical protein
VLRIIRLQKKASVLLSTISRVCILTFTSITAKLSSLQLYLQLKKPMSVFISETWLSSSIDDAVLYIETTEAARVVAYAYSWIKNIFAILELHV